MELFMQLNWVVSNETVFDIETALTLDWIVIYIELFWHLTVRKQNPYLY